MTFDSQLNSFAEILSESKKSIENWAEIDFTSLILRCDEQAVKIAENQEEALASRKALGTYARLFKQGLAAEENANLPEEWKKKSEELLRFFKAEVDRLSTRSKCAEVSFLTTYRLLREAKDPGIEIQHIYETAFAFLKASQAEVERLKAEKKEIEAAQAIQNKASLMEISEEEQQRMRMELEAQFRQDAQQQLQQLQAACQREIASLERMWGEERSAMNLKLEMLQEEAERWQEKSIKYDEAESRLAKSENARRQAEEAGISFRNQILDLQLLLEKQQSKATSTERTLIEVQNELLSKTGRLKHVEEMLKTKEIEFEQETSRLCRELASHPKDGEVLALREKIRILEGLDPEAEESPALLNEEDDQSPNIDEKEQAGQAIPKKEPQKVTGPEKEDSVDDWLVGYNKRLKTELFRAQQNLKLAEEARNEAQLKEKNLQQMIDQQSLSITQLEADLISAHQVVEAGKAMLRSFQTGKMSAQVKQVMLASAVVTGGEKTGDLEGGEGMTVVGGGFGPGDRLLQAIQGQRDRFRKEAQVLDSERSILKNAVGQLKEEVKSLKKDNMHLYKKIRFVENSVTRSTQVRQNKEKRDLEEDGVVASYREQYERLLNPFAQFHHEESKEYIDKMSLGDRVLLTIVKHKQGRRFLMAYVLCVHAYLIFK